MKRVSAGFGHEKLNEVLLEPGEQVAAEVGRRAGEDLLDNVVAVGVENHVGKFGFEFFAHFLDFLGGGLLEEFLENPAAHVLLAEGVVESLEFGERFDFVEGRGLAEKLDAIVEEFIDFEGGHLKPQ